MTNTKSKKSTIVVQKYGGSSLSTAERIRKIAKKICARQKQGNGLVVVVSAMGDSTDKTG